MTAAQFGARIRALRAVKGISQRDMAREIPVSEETISGWERGRNLPTIDTAAIVADFFGVSLDWLAGRAEGPQDAAENE